LKKDQKDLLFSLSKEKGDFVVETFRCGGHGGQNVNKVETGVRIKHPVSGAVVECREERNQLQNRKKAFEKLVKTPEFQKWHKIEVSRRLGNLLDTEKEVNDMMRSHNLRVEIKKDGKWIEVDKKYEFEE